MTHKNRFQAAVCAAVLALSCGDGVHPARSLDGGVDAGADASADASADAGGGAGTPGRDAEGCSQFTFLSPTDGALLSEADDPDGACIPFAISIVGALGAPDLTPVTLLVNGVAVAETQVQGAAVQFPLVELVPGSSVLRVEALDCGSEIEVGVTCSTGAASCTIALPVLSEAHPLLNGEPAPLGDRAGASDSPFRTAFEVQTSAPDGQLVTLEVNGLPNSAVASAAGGVARFEEVQLSPDGAHQVIAHCHAANGQVTQSAPFAGYVDTSAPVLAVTTPLAGEHFGPDHDVDPSTPDVVEIDVCMSTTSRDALDLPATLGLRQQNFCVALGVEQPQCTPATSSAGPNACVRITCPGSASFDLTTRLTDQAGNIQTVTIPSVSCASSKPSVQIVSPESGTEESVETHLLALSAGQTLSDQSGAPGAQWTVRACTNASEGSAVLLAGSSADDLSWVGSPVPLFLANSGDDCPVGLPNVARFVNATLPESEETLSGELISMTHLRVDVTDASSELGQSGVVALWVDSFAPNLSIFSATRCGDLVRTTDPTQAVNFQFATATEVSASLLPPSATAQAQNFPLQFAGLTQPGTFDLEQGQNELTATNTEPSGNVGRLQSPCVIELGDPPIVTWSNPLDDSVFNVSTDGNLALAGWQGDLSVTVSNLDLLLESPAVTVEFFRGATSLGAPVAVDTGTGVATLAGVTIDDGTGVTIRAVTNETSKGVGHASLRQGSSSLLLVDTIAPGMPSNASLAVLERRQTSFRFDWTAPSDGVAQVGGYQVRVHTAVIDATNFDDPGVSKVLFAGSTGAPGTPDVGVNITGRTIEREYYAAVVATDAAGNRSPIALQGPVAARFNVQVLPAPVAGEGFGMAVDGALDLDGEGGSDLVVGTQHGHRVYVWYSNATGDPYSGAADLTITGPTGVGFGNYVVAAGDLNGDTLQDLVVGSPFDNPWGSGLVYVFLQPEGGWPTTLNAASASATVSGDQENSDFDFAFAGGSLARAGDFDGDGLDDVAMGLPYWGPDGFTGYVAVLRGNTALGGAISLPNDVGTGKADRVTAILGQAGLQSGFSSPMVSLGVFYAEAGSTLLVSGWQGSPSRVYAFAGQLGDTSGQIQATAADHTVDSNQGEFGRTLALLGTFAGGPAVGIGVPKITPGGGGQGQVQLFFGSAPNGPFSNVVTVNNAASVAGDLFGTVIVGSAISGNGAGGSFLGSADPDLVVAGSLQQGEAPTLYFIDGQAAHALQGQTVDVADVASVALDLSAVSGLANWVGTGTAGTPIGDLNQDGFMDLAIGEHDASFTQNFDGRVVVIW